jgi:hypothetical protein
MAYSLFYLKEVSSKADDFALLSYIFVGQSITIKLRVALICLLCSIKSTLVYYSNV